MATIINFNQARKKAAKKQKEKTAEENRVKFGRKKSETTLVKKDSDALKSHIDHHKIDDNDD